MDKIWYINSTSKYDYCEYDGIDNNLNKISTTSLNSKQFYQYLKSYDKWDFEYDYENPYELKARYKEFEILFIFNEISNDMFNIIDIIKSKINNKKLKNVPCNDGLQRGATPYDTDCHLVIKSQNNREDCNIFSWGNFLHYLDNSFILESNLIKDGLNLKELYYDELIDKYVIRDMTIYIDNSDGRKLFYYVINEMCQRDKKLLNNIENNKNISKINNLINKVSSFKESNISNNSIPSVFDGINISSLKNMEDDMDTKIIIDYYKKHNKLPNIDSNIKEKINKYLNELLNISETKKCKKDIIFNILWQILFVLADIFCIKASISSFINIQYGIAILTLSGFAVSTLFTWAGFQIIKDNILEYKESDKWIKKMIKELETIDIVKENKALPKDKFLNYIEELNIILEEHPNIMLKNYLIRLLKEYQNALQDKINTGKEIDYSNFIMKYLDIKDKMYKDIYNKNINVYVEQNKMFKDFGLINKDIEDPYLKDMFMEIIRIRNNPYPNCNNDIKRILNLADRYCTIQTNQVDGLTLNEEQAKIIKEMTDLIMSREEIIKREEYKNALISEYEEIEKYARSADEFNKEQRLILKKDN